MSVAHLRISAILFAVLRGLRFSAIFLSTVWCLASVAHAAPRQTADQAQSAPQSGANAPAQFASPQQDSAPPAQAPAAPVHVGPTIVIDAAHGGTDNGAQGPNGIVEKDVVLRFARLIRADFERQGYHVVMTRNDDSNPSYEDRAAAANSHHDAIFITVHVASTGKLATARAYSYKYSNAVPAAAGAPSGAAEVPKNLVVWEEAQRQYLDASHRLADLVQTELAQRFTGSALSSTPFAVRELRSVAAPAIAVEISNISVSDANTLAAMGPSLAGALLRSVQIMRPSPAVPQNSDSAGARPPGVN